MTGLDFVLLYLAGSLTFILTIKIIERNQGVRSTFGEVLVWSLGSWLLVIVYLLPLLKFPAIFNDWQDW